MSDAIVSLSPEEVGRRVEAGLARRRRRENLFRIAGLLATLGGMGFLLLFFAHIVDQGASAFTQTQVRLEFRFDEDLLAPGGTFDPAQANYDAVVRRTLRERFPEVDSRNNRRELDRMVSIEAGFIVRDIVLAEPSVIGSTRRLWVPASSNIDMLVKGNIDTTSEASLRPVSDAQIRWVEQLRKDGDLERRFNKALFVNGDSREPEIAGIRGALIGSFYMLVVTLALSFPLGVAAAIYLAEFAQRSRWADLIEVNINNLAAVPSIVFGLLGLAVFINWFTLPRSSPLVGGLVLSLMTLPVIIITARSAIKAVSPSIREAALALGASRMQVVFHHLLPAALPGILTGTIIGMSRALGETAPLLMIGMVAFIVDVPGGFTDPATALPVQIYLWADSPERAFAERTSAAIIVLLGFLFVMNIAAVVLRKKMERVT
jgi:phosphate transport system permease protein